MFRALTILISLFLSTNSIANGFEAKVPCHKIDNDVFLGWMTKQECSEQQGASPDMLGKKSETKSLTATNFPDK